MAREAVGHMTLAHHPRPVRFDALAAGDGGPDAIRELAAAQYSKHFILVRAVLNVAKSATGRPGRLARDGCDLLVAVQHYRPGIVDEVIRYPSVGAWAQRTLRFLHGDGARYDDGTLPGAEPARLSVVAAAAAIRAGLAAEIEVQPAGGGVVLPSLGAVLVDASSAVVRSGGDAAEIRWPGGRVAIPEETHRDASSWLGLRRFQAGAFRTVIDDLDPFRMPAVNDLAPRLGTREAARWERGLTEGWQVLATDHPDIAAEAAAAITVIVPRTRPRHGLVSSSTPETFGAIALSEPPDPYSCAVTLTHEVQHLKLCALLDIVTLVQPDNGRRVYAPWRPDPRPISGLLQGAYAYLGVVRFWQRQRQLASGAVRARADREFARWRAGVAQALDTLQASSQLTPAGRDFVLGMAKTAAAWRDERVPRQAGLIARRQAESHRARWEAANRPS